MGRRVAWLAAILSAVVLAQLLAPAAAPAAESGAIEGVLTNATTGKPVPNAAVKLYWAKGQEPQPERTTKTDAQGAYRFARLPVGKEYAYVAYSVHQGVEYTSRRKVLTAQRPGQKAHIGVYDSTPLDSALRVKSASFAVLDVNKESQSMFVLETFVFENDSKKTFRPVVNGPRGPMGLLRFSLPPNPSQLSAMGELASREVIQTDRGFGTNLPVRPGRTDVSFTYQVPYRDPEGKLEFDLTMPYPTEDFRLLTPQGGPSIVSPGMERAAPVELFQSPSNGYDVRLKKDLPARARISIAASGLPVNVHFFRPGNPVLWAGSAALLLALVALALLLWRRSPLSSAPKAGMDVERDGLVSAIATLDEQYERGALDERAYRRERELRRQRLLTLMASSPDAS